MQKTQVALFPLQIFLLPQENTVLHVFEERYRQLLEDCENMHTSFGIPFTENGYLTGIGCVVKITKVLNRYPNGTADIEVTASNVFKLEEFHSRLGEKLYPGGDVNVFEASDLPIISSKLFSAIDNYVVKTGIEAPVEFLSAALNIFDVARILELPDIEKIKLVKLGSQTGREKMLLNHIKILDKFFEQKNSIVGEIFLN